MRIAEKVHVPIFEVLEFPNSEIDMWALFFQEEAEELDNLKNKRKKRSAPDNQSTEQQIERFKKVMRSKRKPNQYKK